MKRMAMILALAALLPGCAMQRAQQAAEARQQMLGLSRQDVLACAGIPAQRASEGSVEVWLYPSGNGHTDTQSTASVHGGNGVTSGHQTDVTTRRYCIVNVAMTAGRVSRVTYTGPSGGLFAADEQCAYAVRNCIRQQSAEF